MGEARRRARDYTGLVAGSGRDGRPRAVRPLPEFPVRSSLKAETAEQLIHGSEEKHRIKKQRRRIWRQIRVPRPRTIIITAVCLLLLAGAGWLYQKHREDNAPPHNPFNASILASLKFPAYYPTWLPAGYHIDYSSVQIPQANVVVLTMRGPNGAKLYMSEEIRPDRYNIGGYFSSLGNSREIAVPGGTIAIGTGDDNVTLIGNRLYNNTWVLTNTKAPLTDNQLIKLLRSLTLAY